MNEVVEEERREIKQGRRLKKHFGPLDFDLVAITKKKIERERVPSREQEKHLHTDRRTDPPPITNEQPCINYTSGQHIQQACMYYTPMAESRFEQYSDEKLGTA
jgi:hypothetical protein